MKFPNFWKKESTTLEELKLVLDRLSNFTQLTEYSISKHEGKLFVIVYVNHSDDRLEKEVLKLNSEIKEITVTVIFEPIYGYVN